MEYDYAHTVAHPPPLSIKEIADIAVRFDYNPHVPLRRWLRTADTVLKEVRPPDAAPPPQSPIQRPLPILAASSETTSSPSKTPPSPGFVCGPPFTCRLDAGLPQTRP